VSDATDIDGAKARVLGAARRLVVKVGSNVLAGPDGLRAARVRGIAADLAALVDAGRQIVLVSSGAVAAGAGRLGPRRRGLEWRQAAAAVGQPALMAAYARAFARHGRATAQVLLTHGDLADRRRHLNARHTLRALLDLGVVPIVNENDTVAVEELNFGDNDNLSALTASLVQADLLVILSDVAGLFTADPRVDPAATRIPVARVDDAALARMAGPSRSGVGTGGMASKLAAARTAAAAGIATVIADGSRPRTLARLFADGADVGTLLLADGDPLGHRKHWIAHTLRPQGTIALDAGAERAVAHGGRSLLPSGVRGVEGRFGVGDCVRLVGADGTEIARGLVSYAAADLEKIKGAHTKDIAALLGYKGSDEVVHRDDLVVTRARR
jgi:glutamate 5-kinase